MLATRLIRFALFALVGGAMLAAPQTSHAIFHNWFGHHRGTTTYRPVYSAYYAPTVAYSGCATGGCSTGCSPCASGSCGVQTVGYAPQTCYRTVVQSVPVTAYRAVSVCDPCTGCSRTCMRPVTTYVQRVCRVPYTAYRPVCQTVCSPCCNVGCCGTSACGVGSACCNTTTTSSTSNVETPQPALNNGNGAQTYRKEPTPAEDDTVAER